LVDNVIQIRRSDANTSPESLEWGELAYSFASNTLFIGTSANTILEIGGGKWLDYLNHTPGTLTANSALIVDANSHIDNISVSNFRIQSSGESLEYITEVVNVINSETAANNQIATVYAIKTYVEELAGTNVNITGGSIANVEITSLTEPLATSDGGTGRRTYTENGVAYASSSSVLDFLTGANGDILQITNDEPSFGGIDGGEY